MSPTRTPDAHRPNQPAGICRWRATSGSDSKLTPGPFYPPDPDWGARVACYAMVASGLGNANRMSKAAANLHHADATKAAWWFGLMQNGTHRRVRRVLRIIVEVRQTNGKSQENKNWAQPGRTDLARDGGAFPSLGGIGQRSHHYRRRRGQYHFVEQSCSVHLSLY
ncbi:MAG: hypothetical protein HY260_09490 [Chloroflexi bacterium]|nr:hypothetical protein [Chloroflexota bacterium]